MPICPKCRQIFAYRKKNPAGDGYVCPGCGTPIILHQGEWFSERPNAPTTELVDHFQREFKDRYGSPIIFTGRDIVKARSQAKQLLMKAGGDLELAKKAITVQFRHPKFTWADRFNLGRCFHDFAGAIAIAVGKERRAQQQEEVYGYSEEALEDFENVFDL